MIASYDKIIVLEENAEKKIAVIFDQKKHVPVFYNLEPIGMDNLMEVINSKNEIPSAGK